MGGCCGCFRRETGADNEYRSLDDVGPVSVEQSHAVDRTPLDGAQVSAAERDRRRAERVHAAENRASSFAQGGGGDRLKAKSARIEKLRQARDPGSSVDAQPAMRWTTA